MAPQITFVQALDLPPEWLDRWAGLFDVLLAEFSLLRGNKPGTFYFPRNVAAGDPLLRLREELARADVLLIVVEPTLFGHGARNDEVCAVIDEALVASDKLVIPLVVIEATRLFDPPPLHARLTTLQKIDLTGVRGASPDKAAAILADAARIVHRALLHHEQRNSPSDEQEARKALWRALDRQFSHSGDLLELLDEFPDTRALLDHLPSTAPAVVLAETVARTVSLAGGRALASVLLRRHPGPTGELARLEQSWSGLQSSRAASSPGKDPRQLLRDLLESLSARSTASDGVPAEALLGHLPPPHTLDLRDNPRATARALAHDLTARERVGEGLFLYLSAYRPDDLVDELRRAWPLNPRRQALVDLLRELFRDEVELRSFLRLDPATRFVTAFVSQHHGVRQTARASVELLDVEHRLGPEFFGRLLALFPERGSDITRVARPWLPERVPVPTANAWRDRLAAYLRRLHPGRGGEFAACLFHQYDPPLRLRRVCFATGTPLTAACQLVTALEDGDRLHDHGFVALQRESPEFADELNQIRHQFFLERAQQCIRGETPLERLLGPCRRHAREHGHALLLALLLESEDDGVFSLAVPGDIELPDQPLVAWTSALLSHAFRTDALARVHELFPGHRAAVLDVADGPAETDRAPEDVDDTQIRGLSSFLADVFATPEALRALRVAGDPAAILREVPAVNIDAELHAWHLVRVADRQGALDHSFFDALRALFPYRAAEVDEFRAHFTRPCA